MKVFEKNVSLVEPSVIPLSIDRQNPVRFSQSNFAPDFFIEQKIYRILIIKKGAEL